MLDDERLGSMAGACSSWVFCREGGDRRLRSAGDGSSREDEMAGDGTSRAVKPLCEDAGRESGDVAEARLVRTGFLRRP